MALDIIWLPEAREDVKEIIEFISLDNTEAAFRVFDKILTAVERLQDFPEIGHHLVDVDCPDLRELLVFDYRIIYRFAGGNVEILIVCARCAVVARTLQETRINRSRGEKFTQFFLDVRKILDSLPKTKYGNANRERPWPRSPSIVTVMKANPKTRKLNSNSSAKKRR